MELVRHQGVFRNKLAVVIPDREDRKEKAECFTDYEKAVMWLSEEKTL